MTCNKQLVLKHEIKQSVLRQEPKQIVLVQEIKQLTLCGGPVVANILPFSATATNNGQTVFPIQYTFSTIVCLAVMGTLQNILVGDYTVNGNVVTLGASAPYINVGDTVFGAGQI